MRSTERGPIGLRLRTEERLFVVAPGGELRCQDFLETVVRNLRDGLSRYAAMTVDSGEESGSLEHRSGMAMRIIHEPRSYSLIPLVLSCLDEEFSRCDMHRMRGPARYYGSLLREAIIPLVHQSGNVDIHVSPHQRFLPGQEREMGGWKERADGAIFVSMLASIRSMGYRQMTNTPDTSGIWFWKPHWPERIKFTSSRIPDTQRWSYGLRLYDVHQDERRPPVMTIQVQLDPVTEIELASDRRIGKQVNRRQRIFQKFSIFSDGTMGFSPDDMLSAVLNLHSPDRLEQPPDSLSKLAVIMVRMSRTAAALLLEDHEGVRFLRFPTNRQDFDAIVIERETQCAIQERMRREVAFSGRVMLDQHRAELVKDILVLGPFFGPYFIRAFFSLGGAALLGGNPDYVPDWSETALQVDRQVHDRLERLYRDSEEDLLMGGVKVSAAAHRIASFCYLHTVTRFHQAGLMDMRPSETLFAMMQNISSLRIL